MMFVAALALCVARVEWALFTGFQLELIVVIGLRLVDSRSPRSVLREAIRIVGFWPGKS